MSEPGYELPCEYAAKNVFPSIRASIAKVLVEEFNYTRYSAAKILKITPAAVTYYLSGKRGDKYKDIIMSDERLKERVRSLAMILIKMSEEGEKREIYSSYQRAMCSICSSINEYALYHGCPATNYKPRIATIGNHAIAGDDRINGEN